MKKVARYILKLRHSFEAVIEIHRESVNKIILISVISCLAYLALYPYNYYVINTLPQSSSVAGIASSSSLDDPEALFVYYQDHFLEFPTNIFTVLIVVSVVSLLYKGGVPIFQIVMAWWTKLRG